MTTLAVETISFDIPFDAPFAITKAVEVEAPDAQAGVEKGDWIVEGYAATQHLDLQDDEIEPAAFDDASKDLIKNSTVLFNHDDTKPVAKVLASERREGGLWVRTRISKTEPNLWQKIREGVINKFSIRGKVLSAVKRWNEKLGKYTKLIKKLMLVEVSLVSVPANPEAKTLRWYVAKALDDHLAKSGGGLPVEGPGPAHEGKTMAEATTPTAAPAAPAAPSVPGTTEKAAPSMTGANRVAPDGPPPATASNAPPSDEVEVGLDEGEADRLTQIEQLLEQLMAAEQDEARRGALGEMKGMTMKLKGGKAKSVSLLLFPRIGPRAEQVKASLSKSAKKATLEALVALAESLGSDEKDETRKKSFSRIAETLRPVAPTVQPIQSFEGLLTIADGINDDRVRRAVQGARDIFKSASGAPPAPTPAPVPAAPAPTPATNVITFEQFTKFKSETDALIKNLERAVAIVKGDPIQPVDGKCPDGYDLRDGCCYKKKDAPVQAPPSNSSGPSASQDQTPMAAALPPAAAPVVKAETPAPAAPAPAAPVAPAAPAAASPAPVDMVTAVTKTLKDALAPFNDRLSKIEAIPELKKSLPGQEGTDRPSTSSDPLSIFLRGVVSGALQQAGVQKKPNS